MTFNIDEYEADPFCMLAAEPKTLNYDYHTHPDNFIINVDTRSVSIALAVNEGLLDFNSLREIDSSLKQRFFNQSIGKMGVFFDPRYPDMSVLVCFTIYHLDNLYFTKPVYQCVVEFGQTYAMPVFDHIGQSLDHAEVCDCNNISIDFTDPDSDCNIIRLMAGFIFWNNSSIKTDPFAPVLDFIKKYAIKYPNDLHHLMEFANHDAFPLLYAVSHVGGSVNEPNKTSATSSKANRNLGVGNQKQSSNATTKELYAFCETESFGHVQSLFSLRMILIVAQIGILVIIIIVSPPGVVKILLHLQKRPGVVSRKIPLPY